MHHNSGIYSKTQNNMNLQPGAGQLFFQISCQFIMIKTLMQYWPKPLQLRGQQIMKSIFPHLNSVDFDCPYFKYNLVELNLPGHLEIKLLYCIKFVTKYISNWQNVASMYKNKN